MARRLLGADSANVFNIQEPEETTANQVLRCSQLPVLTLLWTRVLGSIVWQIADKSQKVGLLSCRPHRWHSPGRCTTMLSDY